MTRRVSSRTMACHRWMAGVCKSGPWSKSMASVTSFIERLALWVEVLWSHWSLDTRLAAGFDPASDPALELRAAQLGSARHRRRLAASVERLTRESNLDGRSGISAAVPVVREQVTEARDSLLLLAHTLRNAERVRARGVAMVERLLTDAGSVIYTDSSRGAVDLPVQAAMRHLTGDLQPRRVEARSLTHGWGGPAKMPPHEAPHRPRPPGGHD